MTKEKPIYITYGAHLEEVLATHIGEELKKEKFLEEQGVKYHKWKSGYNRKELFGLDWWTGTLNTEKELMKEKPRKKIIRGYAHKMHKKEYEQKEIGKNENFNNEVESFCKEKVKFIIDLHTSQGSQKEYSKRKEPYIELINPLKLDKNERIQEFIKKLKEKELIVKDMAPPCFIPKNDWIMEIWLPSKEEIHNGLFHTLYYADQVKLWSNHLNEIIEKSKEVIGELVPFLNNFYGDNPELCKEMATIHYKSRIFE